MYVFQYLSLEKDDRTYTITARLTGKRLHSDLIGRYICSEKINHKIQQAAIYVFIPSKSFRIFTNRHAYNFLDDRSVFTKKIYPTVFKETGVHFFNIPCQTTSWHSNISCANPSNSKRGGRDCSPVSYKPANIKTEVRMRLIERKLFQGNLFRKSSSIHRLVLH